MTKPRLAHIFDRADGEWYVEPRDVDGIAAAIRSLRDEPDRRADLIRRGLLQAQEFDWRKTAQAILRAANCL